MPIADEAHLKLLFLEAHTHNGWLDRTVDNALLRRIYEIARMAPTSANTQPVRIVFVKSAAAKERLLPTLSPSNVDKTKTAPVTAILAYDTNFVDKAGKLLPTMPQLAGYLGGMPAEARDRFALLNSSLQAAYVMIAARALGLDCGPMGGFDGAKVDAAFLEGTGWKSFMLLNLGYGDPSKLFPRNPRLDFEEACRIE